MSPVDPYRSENGVPRGRFGQSEPPGEPTLASRTAAQVHEILRVADHQAHELRRQVEDWAVTRVREIEEEAMRHLHEAEARSEALVCARLDPVVALSTVVEERAERLISLLEETDRIKAELRDVVRELRSGLPRSPDGPPGGRTAPPTPPVWGVEQSSPSAVGDEEDARLLALQMAMRGSTRHDVERKLCDELGVRAPQTILDEVFGVGTPSSHRISWNAKPPT